MPITSNNLPAHALEMQTLPRPNKTAEKEPTIKPTPSTWSFPSNDPIIERYPASFFTDQELAMKRKLNLVAVDEYGNEFVYVRKF